MKLFSLLTGPLKRYSLFLLGFLLLSVWNFDLAQENICLIIYSFSGAQKVAKTFQELLISFYMGAGFPQGDTSLQFKSSLPQAKYFWKSKFFESLLLAIIKFFNKTIKKWRNTWRILLIFICTYQLIVLSILISYYLLEESNRPFPIFFMLMYPWTLKNGVSSFSKKNICVYRLTIYVLTENQFH